VVPVHVEAEERDLAVVLEPDGGLGIGPDGDRAGLAELALEGPAGPQQVGLDRVGLDERQAGADEQHEDARHHDHLEKGVAALAHD